MLRNAIISKRKKIVILLDYPYYLSISFH